jgi:hypothetical protein
MSVPIRVVLTAVAVLAGASPLLWVTANEYHVLAEVDERARDREALLERASDLVARGAMDEMGALVQETRERHPDDDALAREISMILLQGAHKRAGAGGESLGMPPSH